MTGTVGCCARAARGQAAAALLMSLMNSRRLIRPLPLLPPQRTIRETELPVRKLSQRIELRLPLSGGLIAARVRRTAGVYHAKADEAAR